MDHGFRLCCRATPLVFATLALLAGELKAQAPRGAAADTADHGYSIDDPTVIARCGACHTRDDRGRMGRLSWLRKTPEGWQTSLRRMVSLNNVSVSPEEARAIVRYLSNTQGLAPEELEPARFEVERRLIEFDYPHDDTEATCSACHSMGRVMTERRTRQEWDLLLATHRALYPLVDFQAFRRGGPPPTGPGPDGSPPDPRHPMEKAVAHLAATFPLETPEWSAWKATMRSPRLEGTWLLSGSEPGRGPVFGTMTIAADAADPDVFTTSTQYVHAESGTASRRTGQALVYTGFQWRGRSNPGAADELREVMMVERDRARITGRWFTGAYDELGVDITLRRVGGEPVIAGVHPKALRAGETGREVRVFGANLPGGAAAADFDFGAGVRVTEVLASDANGARLRVNVDSTATLGERDLFAARASLERAIVVHDGVDRIEVTPLAGMARVGGAHFPKQLQTFDAIGWNDGPDGKSETDDDLALGRVPVTWSIEEYSATFSDDDVSFVGAIDASGRFTPAEDGPNPARSGNRNNIGDVWVVATYSPEAGTDVRPLRARAHLLVTVPLYMRFEPWKEVER
jgi:quinohemoprotein amine dehydrogenase